MSVKVRITVHNNEIIVYSENPGNLLELIAQAGVVFDAPCAGLGRCGKCRVLVQGDLPTDAVETAVLSEDEIKSGVRLACRKRRVPDGLGIAVPLVAQEHAPAREGIEPVDAGIAVDLGTTSIVVAFINLTDGTVMSMHSLLNPQRAHGADIVSRIRAGLDRTVLDRMTESVIDAVTGEIDRMLGEIGLDRKRIKTITIAGNTVMEHIISGTAVASLAKAPFRPVFTRMRHLPPVSSHLALADGSVNLFPLIGGFVGGDTVASILACSMDLSDETVALIDIGTNAEIAVGSKTGIIASSAPAGPAFEGGEIRHGMRAQRGAIDDVRVVDDTVVLSVRGDTEPEGICGSGLVRIVAELVRAGVITRDGELLDAGRIGGNLALRSIPQGNEQAFLLYRSSNREICLYQSDIRAFQLAKASIAAGLKMLMEQAGRQPARLFIAGAFGNYLNPEDLGYLGMIPLSLVPNTFFVGDSVIAGQKRFILNEPAVDMEKLLASIRHLELAGDTSFNDRFLSLLALAGDIL